MVKFKNIILFSPEWRVRRWQGKRKTISNNGNLDPRVADGILAGENDFKISSLDKMAGALNLIYVMIPIPKSPSIICSIRQYAHNTKLYWMISKKKAAEALSHFSQPLHFLKQPGKSTILSMSLIGWHQGASEEETKTKILS